MNNDAFLQFHGHIRTRQQMQKNTVNVEEKQTNKRGDKVRTCFPTH